MSFQKILQSIYVGKKIRKPRTETEILSIDEQGFYYRIGEKNKKKVTFLEIKGALEKLDRDRFINRKWYNDQFEKIAKSKPCNFSTIGGLLVDLGLVEYKEKDKMYYLIKK